MTTPNDDNQVESAVESTFTTMEEGHRQLEISQMGRPPADRTANRGPSSAPMIPKARRYGRMDKDGGMTKNYMEERLFEGMFLRAAFYEHVLDGKRDINAECGYPGAIAIWQYRELYDREGIAKRVVNVLPEESWALTPEVYEIEDEEVITDFEAAWEEIDTKFHLWHWCERIDELSGIGQYGILFLGIDDDLDWSEPAEGINERGEKEGNAKHNLIFIRAFDETVTRVKYREMDPTNPRFGLPTMYTVRFIDIGITGIAQGTDIISKDIHWSRVIHVADNRKMSETYGVPRMQPVYNRLIDLRKILSGSGEMFWKGAFPGISFEVNPELVDQGVTLDPESMRKEFERYENGLQRYLATTGVTAKSLQIQVSSPKDHVEAHMSAIAVTLGIPKRILFGSEQAQLASSQDAMAWNKRVNRRQTKYVTPLLIQPIVDRLIAFSVMPGPVKSYKIDWPDLDSPTDADKAQIALQKTQALAAYVTGGVDQLIPPKPYLTMILDMTPEEADVIEEKAEGYAADNPPGQTDENGNPVGNPVQQTDQDGNPIVPGASGPVPVGGAAGGTGGNNAPSNAGSLRTEGGVPGKQKPIKKGPQMQRGTATTPSSYPGGLGQPMPPYSIPPGAGVGGGTPAVPISGQKQRGKVQGTQQKEYPQKASSVNPQGKPGPAETSVHRGKVSPSNPGGGGPKTKGNKQRRLKASEQPGKREKGKPGEPFTH